MNHTGLNAVMIDSKTGTKVMGLNVSLTSVQQDSLSLGKILAVTRFDYEYIRTM